MRCGRAFSVAVVAMLLACTPTPPAGPAPEAVAVCSGYGFPSGSPGFSACMAKLDPLARAGDANRAQCEAVRRQAPAMTTTGGFPAGFGSSVVQADAAYRLCLSERVPAPVQIQIPDGRSVTCQLVETHLQCY